MPGSEVLRKTFVNLRVVNKSVKKRLRELAKATILILWMFVLFIIALKAAENDGAQFFNQIKHYISEFSREHMSVSMPAAKQHYDGLPSSQLLIRSSRGLFAYEAWVNEKINDPNDKQIDPGNIPPIEFILTQMYGDDWKQGNMEVDELHEEMSKMVNSKIAGGTDDSLGSMILDLNEIHEAHGGEQVEYNFLFQDVLNWLQYWANERSKELRGEFSNFHKGAGIPYQILPEKLRPQNFDQSLQARLKHNGPNNDNNPELEEFPLTGIGVNWIESEAQKYNQVQFTKDLLNTFMLLLVLGALGSLIFLLQDFLSFDEHGRSVYDYLFRPFFGMFLSLASFVVVVASQSLISDNINVDKLDRGPLYLLALAAGLLSEKAYNRLKIFSEESLDKLKKGKTKR
ncbi:MAG: hypothetical protein AAF649_11230 [Verrucomicrobiota bacterium]